MPPHKPTPTLGPLDALALASEVAMVALLVAAGHGLAGGWKGWVFGILLAGVALMIWSQWMAPMSMRRLDDPARLVIQIALFLATAMYAAAGGLLWWGLAFAVVSITVFAVHRD